MDIIKTLTSEFKLQEFQIQNTVDLLDDGRTVPFIARYRKEMTGSLDDKVIREIETRLNYLRNLENRKDEIFNAISELGKMTPEIKKSLDSSKTMTEVEDVWLPFKKKKKTKADIAKEKGLEPLSLFIMLQNPKADPDKEAAKFIDIEKDVNSAQEALDGAFEIIQRNIAENSDVRKKARDLLSRDGVVTVKADDPDAESVYTMYYDFSMPIKKIKGHQILAINRGEKEGFIKAKIDILDNEGEKICEKNFVINDSKCGEIVKEAADTAWKNSIYPAASREVRNELTDSAQDGAIKVFSENLKQLLLQPPFKNSVTLGFDPGYRNGCKTAVVDENGKVLDTTIVYQTAGNRQNVPKAEHDIINLINKYNVTSIAIGNGTASRESEEFIAELLKKCDHKVSYMVVSEAGASVYSASKLAEEEFPDMDATLRSAVSIARRLQDPLAELVKIPPEAIGIGQYQHDIPQKKLSEALGGVVEDCVNSVGVDLNTASYSLLSYIAGINLTIAKNIVKYREQNGAFKNKKQLNKVPRLGPRAFEECAGFLRIRNGDNPLDNTGVHPESFSACENMLSKFGYNRDNFAKSDMNALESKVKKYGKEKLAKELEIGVPTLLDIIKELKKPGLDPRDELPKPLMRSGDIMEIEDLKPGDILTGTVRNITDFGAFIDIGVHQDGLCHISQLSDKYVKSPLDVVKVGQIVKVKVLEADAKKKRISLSMKGLN